MLWPIAAEDGTFTKTGRRCASKSLRTEVQVRFAQFALVVTVVVLASPQMLFADQADRTGVTSAGHALWSRAFVKSSFERFDSSPVRFGSGIVVLEVPRGISAIDARNGRPLWSTVAATDGAIVSGDFVFANHTSLADDTLLALNARTGTVLWRKPKMGGIKVADAKTLFVSNPPHGTTSYRYDGHFLWNSPRGRGDIAILLDGAHVVVVGIGGEPGRGVLYSLDRKTGHYIGSNPHWIGRILEVNTSEITAQSTFVGEVSFRCLGATLVTVALAKQFDPSDLDPFLTDKTKYYPVNDAPIPKNNLPCVGDRGPASAFLDQATIAVSSGHLTTLYDRNGPDGRATFLDNAKWIGGPFNGYFFVSDGRDLEAVGSASGRVRRLRLLSPEFEPGFSVTGEYDRVYASDGTNIYAFEASNLSHSPIKRYEVKCPAGITAIARVPKVDILECDADDFTGRVVGLPL
jgi:outer membrane protein assembly factor BamB